MSYFGANHRIFPFAKTGSQSFIALYDNECHGLLHIVARHYCQFQKAIPALEAVLLQLPLDLQNLLMAATGASSLTSADCLADVASFLLNKDSATKRLLTKAQNLVAAYFDAVLTPSRWLKKTTTKGGKLQHRFEVKLDGADAELILGTSKDVQFPRIITAYFKMLKPTPTSLPPSPAVQPTPSPPPACLSRKKSHASTWTQVPSKKKKCF